MGEPIAWFLVMNNIIIIVDKLIFYRSTDYKRSNKTRTQINVHVEYWKLQLTCHDINNLAISLPEKPSIRSAIFISFFSQSTPSGTGTIFWLLHHEVRGGDIIYWGHREWTHQLRHRHTQIQGVLVFFPNNFEKLKTMLYWKTVKSTDTQNS